jgi:hypothetical protein
MGLQQVAISVCNDGNVSQLDCTDVTNGGVHYRIEVYRASQPSGGYGVTLSGSRVENICGIDHLKEKSNTVFRYTFSVGNEKTNKSEVPILLEGREEFNPIGTPDGSWEVRIRDLDTNSESYGSIIVAKATPIEGTKQYHLHYELRLAEKVKPVTFYSPIHKSVTELNHSLVDLGESFEKLPPVVGVDDENGFSSISKKPDGFTLKTELKTLDIDKELENVMTLISQPIFKKFIENLDLYEAFGDFGHKGIHPGTNLIGPNAKLAAESIFVRQYRAALVLLGRIVSPDMARGALEPKSLADALTNTRPGVYAIFVGAAINNIGIYKLGLDKVHSDYGGIPMKLAPGSRLENGAKPIADAWRCNQTLGDVATLLYLNK